MTKRIYLTGAAGFIGFHLAQALHKKGYLVYGYDNFNDYYDVELKNERAYILKSLGIEVEKNDLVDFKALEDSVNRFNPTHFVHLAAQAGVRYSLVKPHSYIQSNLVGFTNVLEVLKSKPHIPLYYASSSSVYGDNAQIPFSEKDPCDQPINLYGATKKANELMAYAYHKLYQIKTVGFRFFTVYGPYGRPDMAYFHFANQMIQNKPIQVYQGDTIQRDFTYIDDVVQGIMRALEKDFECEVFNLGNHKPVLLKTFIELLEKSLGLKAQKEYLPRAKGDMEKTYADLSKSQRLLGYLPTTDLEEGLKNFAQWFLSYSQALGVRQTK